MVIVPFASSVFTMKGFVKHEHSRLSGLYRAFVWSTCWQFVQHWRKLLLVKELEKYRPYVSEVILYDLTSPFLILMEPSALTIEIRNTDANSSEATILSFVLIDKLNTFKVEHILSRFSEYRRSALQLKSGLIYLYLQYAVSLGNSHLYIRVSTDPRQCYDVLYLRDFYIVYIFIIAFKKSEY